MQKVRVQIKVENSETKWTISQKSEQPKELGNQKQKQKNRDKVENKKGIKREEKQKKRAKKKNRTQIPRNKEQKNNTKSIQNQ